MPDDKSKEASVTTMESTFMRLRAKRVGEEGRCHAGGADDGVQKVGPSAEAVKKHFGK